MCFKIKNIVKKVGICIDFVLRFVWDDLFNIEKGDRKGVVNLLFFFMDGRFYGYNIDDKDFFDWLS